MRFKITHGADYLDYEGPDAEVFAGLLASFYDLRRFLAQQQIAIQTHARHAEREARVRTLIQELCILKPTLRIQERR